MKSANTTLLGIETKGDPESVYEILYGYRWIFAEDFTFTVLGGTWFTSSKIYPSLAIPIGYVL